MNLTGLARAHGDKLAVIMGDCGGTVSCAELERQSTRARRIGLVRCRR
jgi:hypothetical protein